MRFSCLSLSLLLASCHQVSAIQSPVSVLDVPRGGAIVEPEQLILLKKVGFAATGVLAPAVNVFQDVYKTEPLPEGTLKGYCAESFCWSLLGVALLMHYATKMTVGTDRALGLSALPTLYFYYKETLKGTYGKLGYSKGTGPAIAAVVALCVGSILTKYGLDADLASKILIGLTVVSCGISSFAPEKGASLKGVSLGAGGAKWWSAANKAALLWAVLAACLKKGVGSNKAIGYSVLAWAAFSAHSKIEGTEIFQPVVANIYLVVSLVVGSLLSFTK